MVFSGAYLASRYTESGVTCNWVHPGKLQFIPRQADEGFEIHPLSALTGIIQLSLERPLLLVPDVNVVDLLPLFVDTRLHVGTGLAIRRKYGCCCLDDSPGLCSGELKCGSVDLLVRACVVIGVTR